MSGIISNKTPVDRVLLAILSALIDCGKTPDEIREGWATVAEAVGLDAKHEIGAVAQAQPERVATPTSRTERAD